MTIPSRRDEIRLAFRERFRNWIAPWVQSALEERGVSEPGQPAIEEVSEESLDRVFSPAPWDKTLRSYRPPKGMTFENYVQRQLLWRIKDAADAFADRGLPVSLHAGHGEEGGAEGPEGTLAGTLEDVSAAPPSESLQATEETETRITNTRAALDELFACLRRKRLTDRKVAIVYLHFKAYVEPESIPTALLLELGVKQAALVSDYHAAARELAAGREEYLQASTELARKQAVFEVCGRTLRNAHGLQPHDFSVLDQIARKTSITELAEELNALDETREQRWESEVRYMLARNRLGKAQAGYLEACAGLKRFTEYKKPFIREQKEIALLLRVSAGALGRERAEALAAAKECLQEIFSGAKFDSTNFLSG